MSYTKYVMFNDGTFLFISKYAGVEHSVLAQYGPGLNQVSQAGFLHLSQSLDNLQSYGKSISIGKISDTSDGSKIWKALNAGEVKIFDHPAGFEFAGNAKVAESLYDAERPATLEELIEVRILDPDA